jgi:carbon storage regulator
MLVLTRKKDQKVIIGNEIEIHILRVGRENVRIGVTAPAHIAVHRQELFEEIKRQDPSAATSQLLAPETLKKLLQTVEAK